MKFEIPGPLRVRAGNQPVPVTAAMSRTLLGILLARADTPVPVGALVDALWASRRVESAHKKLQLHVHRLRALGGPGADPLRVLWLHTAGRPDELDADRRATGRAFAVHLFLPNVLTTIAATIRIKMI